MSKSRVKNRKDPSLFKTFQSYTYYFLNLVAFHYLQPFLPTVEALPLVGWLRRILRKKTPPRSTVMNGNTRKAQEATDNLKLPDFDDLPKVEGMPQGCAWGVFDNGGKKDVFGTLNLLSPSVIKAAAREVQEGVSISLK